MSHLKISSTSFTVKDEGGKRIFIFDGEPSFSIAGDNYVGAYKDGDYWRLPNDCCENKSDGLFLKPQYHNIVFGDSNKEYDFVFTGNTVEHPRIVYNTDFEMGGNKVTPGMIGGVIYDPHLIQMPKGVPNFIDYRCVIKGAFTFNCSSFKKTFLKNEKQTSVSILHSVFDICDVRFEEKESAVFSNIILFEVDFRNCNIKCKTSAKNLVADGFYVDIDGKETTYRQYAYPEYKSL